eukprot:jgi/Tetstr1/435204/TSEL_024124.t1
MTYVAKWCLHADKREDTGPDDACYLLTLVPAALTPVARLGSMSSMTEHAANTELPGLIAPAAAHWVEQRRDWLALLPTLPPWRAAPPGIPGSGQLHRGSAGASSSAAPPRQGHQHPPPPKRLHVDLAPADPDITLEDVLEAGMPPLGAGAAAPSPHGSAHQLPPHLPPPAQAQTDPTSDFQLLGGMLMEIQKQMAAQTAVVALLRDEMAERRRETSHLNNVVTALQAGAPLVSQVPLALAAPGAPALPRADMDAGNPQVDGPPLPQPHGSAPGAHEGSAPP